MRKIAEKTNPPVTLLNELSQDAKVAELARMISGEIVSMEKAISTGLPIREVEIVDALIPNLEDDVLSVNMVQRMTDSGRRVRFNVLAAVGNKDGYIGIGMAKGKEVPATIQKAISVAKLNIIPVLRGNGSWESGIGPGTSIPIEVTGRSSSTRLTLIPAPSGKGLVVGPVGRRVLSLAGITDIWSRSKGQTRIRCIWRHIRHQLLQPK